MHVVANSIACMRMVEVGGLSLKHFVPSKWARHYLLFCLVWNDVLENCQKREILFECFWQGVECDFVIEKGGCCSVVDCLQVRVLGKMTGVQTSSPPTRNPATVPSCCRVSVAHGWCVYG